MSSIDDKDMIKDDLIDLRSKSMLKQAFNSQNLDEFWCSQLGKLYKYTSHEIYYFVNLLIIFISCLSSTGETGSYCVDSFSNNLPV